MAKSFCKNVVLNSIFNIHLYDFDIIDADICTIVLDNAKVICFRFINIQDFFILYIDCTSFPLF